MHNGRRWCWVWRLKLSSQSGFLSAQRFLRHGEAFFCVIPVVKAAINGFDCAVSVTARFFTITPPVKKEIVWNRIKKK